MKIKPYTNLVENVVDTKFSEFLLYELMNFFTARFTFSSLTSTKIYLQGSV